MLAIILGTFILIGVIVIIWAISTYNNFITLKERVSNAKAQIAAQIESRWDAVHSLISATKKYAMHEAEVLESVTRQRTGIGKLSSVKELQRDEAQFNQVFGRIMAVAEANPDLKANTVYQNTMTSIDKFENYVRNSRMIYNDCVTMLNRKIKMFPSSAIASMFNISEEGYFEVAEEKRELPSWD